MVGTAIKEIPEVLKPYHIKRVVLIGEREPGSSEDEVRSILAGRYRSDGQLCITALIRHKQTLINW